MPRFPGSLTESVERVVDHHHGEDADRQLPSRRQLLVGGELVGGADPGLADAGDAEGEEALPRRMQSVLQFGAGGAGNLFLDQTHSRLAEETRRLALLVAIDLPALGVRSGS